jgi:hypothetical protein
MFKLRITPRARIILDRLRDLINDCPNCATAAEAPLDGAQERYHFYNRTTHTRGVYQHGKIVWRICFALYFFAVPRGLSKIILNFF